MRGFDPNTHERPLDRQMLNGHVRRDCSTATIGTLGVLALAIVLGSLFWNITDTNRVDDSSSPPSTDTSTPGSR